MEIRKRTVPYSTKGEPIKGQKEREFIFFEVEYNHFRSVDVSPVNAVLDREDMRKCECVLCLPDNYSENGDETPLILSFHGAGGRVCEKENLVGGLYYISDCIDAGYALLDVCGSEPHGLTMGCPEHLFAIYKAYRYAVKHYNLSKNVLVFGASMGGHVAMNFINTFPNIVTAAGLFYPRLNMEGVEVDGHYCIGTWDKTAINDCGKSNHELIKEIYRFPNHEWCEATTVGFNPYRSHCFIDNNGKRAIIPPCPIKIWQGTSDKIVDPVMVREFVASVRRSGSYIELHEIEGIGHSINDVMRTEITMWFNRFI